MSEKFAIFISVKQNISDISVILSGLSEQLKSMQGRIDSQHAEICAFKY